MEDINPGGLPEFPDDRRGRDYVTDDELFQLVIDPDGKYAKYVDVYRPFMAQAFARAHTEEECRLVRIEICRRVFSGIIADILANRRIRAPPVLANQRGAG